MSKAVFRYNGRESKEISIKISPQADFREPLGILESLQFPDTAPNSEIIKYSVLELLNNSLRAHRENNVDESISVTFKCQAGNLLVSVRDHGRGFDPRLLPYSIDENADEIDLHSPAFEHYRKEHDFKRFGVGVYLAKKTFNRLQILFFDHEGNETEWKPGEVAGTVIQGEIRLDDDGIG